jgi:hypothetical protein
VASFFEQKPENASPKKRFFPPTDLIQHSALFMIKIRQEIWKRAK